MVNLMLMLVLSLKEPPSVIVDVDKLEAASRQRTCTCAGGFVECGLGVGRGRGSRQLRCNKPGWRRQVVVVPTVLKGINNQRMRLVSDIVGSILIGAAVELPPVLATRRACHFDVSCYQRYEPILPIWEVFNRNATLAALEEAGACVVEPQQGGRRIQSVHIRLAQGEVLPLRKPIGASKLERFATHNMLVGSDSLPDSLRRISFGGPSDCCVLFVPDTIRARQLFRRVNAAFITSPALRLIAHTALSHFRDTIGGQPQDEPPYSTLALHWRAETDMSNSSHALSSHAFRSSVKHALRLQHAQARGSQNASRMHNRPLTHVLVLGDQNATDAIHKQLRSPAWLRIHSKTTLLGSSAIRRMLPAGLAEMDDAVGMVDFEIGLQVDRFIGAPFSSFSVMIALARVAAVNASCVTPRCRRERHADDSGTLMLNGTDTVDQLAAIFAVAFPYTAHIPFDPCGDLVQLHPAFGKARGKASGLFKCPMRTFTVSRIDLDRPEACFCGPTNFCESLLQSQRGFVPADEWDQCQPLPSFDGLCDNLAAKHLMKFRHTPQQALLAVSEVDVWQQLVPPSLLAQINAPPLSRGPSSEDRHHSLCPELAPRFVFDPPLDLGCHLVVATATFGAREPVGGLDLADVVELKQDESKEHVESCFFAFVDEEAALATLASGTQQQQPQLQSHQQQQVGQASYRLVPFGGWTLVVLSKAMLPFEDYNRNSRIPKMLMHMAFSHATYAMYLDAKLRFRKGSLALLWRFVSARFTGKEPEWDLRQPRPIPVWVSPKHDKRASAYDEARSVSSRWTSSRPMPPRGRWTHTRPLASRKAQDPARLA